MKPTNIAIIATTCFIVILVIIIIIVVLQDRNNRTYKFYPTIRHKTVFFDVPKHLPVTHDFRNYSNIIWNNHKTKTFDPAFSYPKKYCYSNWCLWTFDGEFKAIIRKTKFCGANHRGSYSKDYNNIVMGTISLDEKISWLGNPKIQLTGGFEDFRALQIGEDVLVWGSFWSPNKPAKMFAKICGVSDGLPILNLTKGDLMPSPTKRKQEKNWAFFAKYCSKAEKHKIYFIHSLCPLHIYSWDPSKTFHLITRNLSNALKDILPFEHIRTSTSLHPDNDGTWVGVGHIVIYNRHLTKLYKTYLHFFFWLASDLSRLVAATSAFRFKNIFKQNKNEWIQFAMGLVVRPDHYLVSYGDNDNYPALAKISKRELEFIKYPLEQTSRKIAL